MTNAVKEWLDESSGSRWPAFKFKDIGDTIVGRIVEKVRPIEVDDINGKGKVTKLVLAIETQKGTKGYTGPQNVYEPITVGETYALWLSKGLQGQAAAEACAKAGVEGMAEDDYFAMAYVADKDTGKPQPARVYEAELTVAKPKVGLKALLGEDE